jgi:uncharacterized membrane protein YfcA
MRLRPELLWLPAVVFVTGQLGAWLGSGARSSERLIRVVTGGLMLVVGARAVWRGLVGG